LEVLANHETKALRAALIGRPPTFAILPPDWTCFMMYSSISTKVTAMNSPRIESHRKSGNALPRLATVGSIAMLAASGLSGCLATAPTASGSGSAATGSAGGATTAGANSTLEKCPATLGTIRIDEQTNAAWYGTYASRYGTGSTVPALRLLVQQSNCFVIVDRGRGLAAGNAERALIRGDEGRAGSNMGTGQIAAADFTMIPEVIVSDRGGTRGGGGLAGLGRLFGGTGAALGAVAGNFSTNEAGTILTLIDNRSSVQLAASEGYAKNTDFGGFGNMFGSGAWASAGAMSSTPQGKVVFASFADAYNKMVQAVREYKAQTVKGGLGTGGQMGVQGGSTPSSKDVGKKK
jgi:curli biogenesis system outer membrane secretion channel CsgG